MLIDCRGEGDQPRPVVLREIAEFVLSEQELLDAFDGARTVEVRDDGYRGRSGVLCGPREFVVHGQVVDVVDWHGLTEQVPIGDVLAVAAQHGTAAARHRLAVAIADHPKAIRRAERYIRAHGPDGGHCLTWQQTQAPEWRLIVAELGAVRDAVHAWWHPPVAEPTGPPGEQFDLFAMAGAS